MNEMIAIAAAILGWQFPRKGRVGDGLYDCLERVCPLNGDDRVSLESRNARYQRITQCVLEFLREGPVEVLEWTPDGEPKPLLPLADLRAVVREVRREVERWCRLALFWSQADVIPWYDSRSRTLYVDGRMAYRWSGHAPADGPQLTLLAAFQELEWAEAIDCPLPPSISTTDTCRKLNDRVGHQLRFEVCGEQIRWRYVWRRPCRARRAQSDRQPTSG
jgi:hypothetical protein